MKAVPIRKKCDGFGEQAHVQIIVIFGNGIDKEKDGNRTLGFVTVMETHQNQ